MRSNSGETDADLDTVMAGAPDAILLPGSLGAASVQQLSAKLAVREAKLGLEDGATRVIAVADTAQALFNLGSYRGASARLMGVAWSAESLRADIGAEMDRDPLGDYLGVYRLARDLTLLAATSARVAAIDAAFANIRDPAGLRAEALAARRDGFTGKDRGRSGARRRYQCDLPAANRARRRERRLRKSSLRRLTESPPCAPRSPPPTAPRSSTPCTRL